MRQSRKLVLVRHGETDGESSIRYHGRNDVPLSDLGRAQMRAVGDALAERGYGFVAPVWASPLCRAAEGARLIAGADAAIITVDDFAEINFGLFEGLTAEEIRSRHPREFGRWQRNRFDDSYTYPGGESRAAFNARVRGGLDRLMQRWNNGGDNSAGRSALIVAHRGVIREIVRLLAGTEVVSELGSMQILEHHDRWRPLGLDLTDHLRQLADGNR